MKQKKEHKIVVLTTVHEYSDARIFYKEIYSIKKKYKNLVYIAKHHKKESFIEDDVIIDPIPIPRTRFERFFKTQYRSYKKIIKHNPDIVHFHDPELQILMWIIKKRLKCKIIFDIHENVASKFVIKPWLPKIIKPFVPKIYNIFEKFFISSFDKLIIVLDSFKLRYSDEAVTIKNYPIITTARKNVIKDFSGPLNLVYVGLITKERGILQVLKVFKHISEKFEKAHLNLVGRIDTFQLEKDIQNYIIENNLSQKITIHGAMNITKAYKLLDKSHFGFALLEPIKAHREALATKIFDYMVNGVPYVVSDIEIYNYYTVEAHTGIVANYYDIDEIVNKITELFENRSKLQVMSRNGIEAVFSKWNWENEAAKLIQIYDELLSNEISK